MHNQFNNTFGRHALIAGVLFLLISSLGASAQVDITMWGVDDAHSSVHKKETILSPIDVPNSTFGQPFSEPLDGQVYGRVLYAGNLHVNRAMHNVAYVGSSN